MDPKDEKRLLRKVELTVKDWQDAMRGNVYKNRKKYSRKSKHKQNEKDN